MHIHFHSPSIPRSSRGLNCMRSQRIITLNERTRSEGTDCSHFTGLLYPLFCFIEQSGRSRATLSIRTNYSLRITVVRNIIRCNTYLQKYYMHNNCGRARHCPSFAIYWYDLIACYAHIHQVFNNILFAKSIQLFSLKALARKFHVTAHSVKVWTALQWKDSD